MDRSEDELKAAAELVLAEHRRLLLAAERLGRLHELGLDGGDEFNAFLESFLLHYRNLVDFLQPRRAPQPDDVQAQAFLLHARELEAPIEYRRAIDKRLSHITFYRLGVAESSRGWDVSRMLRELETDWNAFLTALGEDAPGRAAWFQGHSADSVGEPPRLVPDPLLWSASTSPPSSVTFTHWVTGPARKEPPPPGGPGGHGEGG